MKPFAYLLFALLITVMTLPTFAQDSSEVEIIGGDEEVLRELLRRIVTPMFELDDYSVTVNVGGLPENLAFDIPMPEGAHVVGSASSEGSFTNIQIFLNAPQSPEELREFYHSAFTTQGWTEPPTAVQQSGFVSPIPGMLSLCRGENTYLNLFVHRNNSGTEVTLHVQMHEFSVCDSSSGITSSPPLVPTLIAPEGVIQLGSSSGGFGEQQHISTILTTDLSPQELALHYGQQLEAQGWTLTSETHSEMVSVSTWSLFYENELWNGALVITGGGAERLSALLEIVRAA